MEHPLTRRLRALIERRGTNIRQLSIRAGIARGTIYRFLEDPEGSTTAVLLALADALDVELRLVDRK